MTQEEKDLLIKDLSARLPYGIKAKVVTSSIQMFELGQIVEINGFKNIYDGVFYSNDISLLIGEFLPYLRRMSSMTEEEITEMKKYIKPMLYPTTEIQNALLDYLHSIHVDTRSWIDYGLALEAPEGMYK